MKKNPTPQKTKKTLGFIVEGNIDMHFIQFLVRDYFNNEFQAEIVCTMGKASMASSAKIIVSSFIQSGVDHVFMLFDTDNIEIEKQLQFLSEPLEKAGFMENVTIIPIQPCIELWMLSAFISNPEELKNMDIAAINAKLLEYGIENKNQLFIGKNIEKMIAHNADFKDFLKKIEEKIAA